MSPRNDGERYDPDDPGQRECLRKAKCYIDRTVDLPVIRMVKYKDFEIIGWVWFKANGELKANGVNVKKGDGRYFIYNNKKFPPGIYYLVRRHGREVLISDEFLSTL